MEFNIYDFTSFTQSIHRGLSESLSPLMVQVIEWTLIGLAFLLFVAVFGLILVYVERKVCAFFQQRLGPMRVGKWGLLQTIADFIKLLMKELITPNRADKFLYNLAPFIVIIVSFLAISVVPWAKGLQALDFDIGVFYVTAVSSVGVIGILLAGWASNNKYSLIGAMRSGAQIVSYELSVGLSLITMIILAGTMQISEIVEAQRGGWFIFTGHIPAIIAFFSFYNCWHSRNEPWTLRPSRG